MPHISYSELKNWNFCPFYHKLVNIDKLKAFQGNEYTAFGNAVHETCEKLLTDGLDDKGRFFQLKFKERVENLPKNVDIDEKLVESMKNQGENTGNWILM